MEVRLDMEALQRLQARESPLACGGFGGARASMARVARLPWECLPAQGRYKMRPIGP